jgi:uncharacterized glyoxalase superfamily metalloenzyme YdcJ
VGYYDLSQAGLLMHATCFRPTNGASLERNPLRVFTTLLRPEPLKDARSRNLALDLLSTRNIFSAELISLLDVAESQGSKLRSGNAVVFVQKALTSFEWRSVATASKAAYQRLRDEHPILSDITCFQSAHINHLTLCTLNIEAAQMRMRSEEFDVKECIEGPPARRCPVPLRQTSFLALNESTSFPGDGGLELGYHKARFGEIEERGVAVNARGRALHDDLLNEAGGLIATCSDSAPESQKDKILANVFGRFPDTWDSLRQQKLVYFSYRVGASADFATVPPDPFLEELVRRNILVAVPMTYEDFLPMSAAGSFRFNLGTGNNGQKTAAVRPSDQDGLYCWIWMQHTPQYKRRACGHVPNTLA